MAISPYSGPGPSAPLGTPDLYREAIAEALAMAVISVEIGMKFADSGDDTGLEYAIRHLVAYSKAVLSLMGDLKAMKATQAQRKVQETADA